jgi:septum formation protein
MKSLLYLASASPRRHELLNQIGLTHTVIDVPSPPGEDEPRQTNESPLIYVQRTAHEKALRAQDWLVKEGNIPFFSKAQILSFIFNFS